LEEEMRFSKEEKEKLLEEWKLSGKSAWSFAREKTLCQQTFAKWVRTEKERKNGFVQIAAQKMSASRNSAEILIEKGDMKIHVPLNISSNEITTLLKGLQTSI